MSFSQHPLGVSAEVSKCNYRLDWARAPPGQLIGWWSDRLWVVEGVMVLGGGLKGVGVFVCGCPDWAELLRHTRRRVCVSVCVCLCVCAGECL